MVLFSSTEYKDKLTVMRRTVRRFKNPGGGTSITGMGIIYPSWLTDLSKSEGGGQHGSSDPTGSDGPDVAL